ncbi:glycine--tRNA ligase subunit beta [Parvibium lacunae]|uniref:Glycine--tRNA ligase beta subunit n=1 Tax=Parvibium lacunae TaxID=1888893 RepID=A0A368L4M9_9BURK|nr:glycine--tRNA ligase subunit beta [Parvibium lacunae]RCS58382.1 glycine--tRNA ligase subunit beta [Parvibium lacunae]
MSQQANLLLELFVEELPPKALFKLGEAFAGALSQSLQAQGLCDLNVSAVTPYATPRRLAVHISQVAAQAADKAVNQKLMPATVGLDANGQPTPALLKKLSALGADASAVSALTREHDGKAEVLFLATTVKGASLLEGLQKALDEAIAKLPIPKVMSYQLADGWSNVNFVRPVHGLVALHGAEIVPVQAFGLTANRLTQGHRFEAAQATIIIEHADSYAAQLRTQGAVIASYTERRAEISRQLRAVAKTAGANLQPIDDEALLDEVTALVERPNVLLGQFEAAFLAVPQECLILTMKANQKYFPLLDGQGKLTNQFLIVSNISPADPSAVIGGNERVVRPRLADAKFFFDQDRKKTLQARVTGLDKVVYHNKLGSQGERIQRVAAIAKAIGEQLGSADLAQQAAQAATLAKADLLTDMVGEFPELQGIMGRYYALNDGLSTEIADAIEDHYKPRFAGDELPRNLVGVCVALADKLETLVGLFGIGQIPTGDKDPFALRRHALGVIRMLMERELPLALNTLLQQAMPAFGNLIQNNVNELEKFMADRLAGVLREQGYSAQEVDAVLALQPQVLQDIPKRLQAVRAFATMDESTALAAANKRIGNILKKSEDIGSVVDTSYLKEPAEQQLHGALHNVQPLVTSFYNNGEYTAALRELAVLKGPVDTFFDQVMVNADDPALKANRLALLQQLYQAMNRVADLAKLAA